VYELFCWVVLFRWSHCADDVFDGDLLSSRLFFVHELRRWLLSGQRRLHLVHELRGRPVPSQRRLYLVHELPIRVKITQCPRLHLSCL
jgi:hypothetical protein